MKEKSNICITSLKNMKYSYVPNTFRFSFFIKYHFDNIRYLNILSLFTFCSEKFIVELFDSTKFIREITFSMKNCSRFLCWYNVFCILWKLNKTLHMPLSTISWEVHANIQTSRNLYIKEIFCLSSGVSQFNKILSSKKGYIYGNYRQIAIKSTKA